VRRRRAWAPAPCSLGTRDRDGRCAPPPARLCDARGMTDAPGRDDVERAVRAAFGRDTCDPHDVETWHAANPARGHCGVTALVVAELLGGELLLAPAYAGGAERGIHYWNRLPDGAELDLTADQFGPDEAVGEPRVVPVPDEPPVRCRAEYETFRRRVLAALGRTDAPAFVPTD
jgi:hypothetical protein